jgi:hypothetical protein
LPHKGFSKIATETILTTKERARRIAGKTLDMKREFITAWEIQFLNGTRVLGIQPEDLTATDGNHRHQRKAFVVDRSFMQKVMV